MKSSPFLVVAVACLAVAGCRVDPNIALLERELRLQEDEIYRLRARLEESEGELQGCPLDEDFPLQLNAPQPPSNTLLDRARPRGVPDPATADKSSPPAFSKGDPGIAPPWNGSSNRHGPGDRQPQPSSDPLNQGAPEPIAPGIEEPNGGAAGQRADPMAPAAAADGRQVTQLVLNRLSTRGFDADGRPGDEGIRVVVQPHDALGRPLEASAAVAVVVIDPKLDVRVARWDFSAAETAARFRGPGRGIELEMLWPDGPPVNRDLHLFVRYMTGDGRKLEVDAPIRVAPPGQRVANWVPTSPPPRIATRPPEPSPRAAEPRPRRPEWSPDRL